MMATSPRQNSCRPSVLSRNERRDRATAMGRLISPTLTMVGSRLVQARACSAPIESGGILVGPRMGEAIGIDSLLGGWAMPKAYSGEMRERVIAEVESGASRREAAEEFAVSASTAVIWVKCFRQTGRCAAKPRGGSI